MKKTLKSAGAIGLAAATILTGLSFGPSAASAAPPSDEAAAGTISASAPFQPIFKSGTRFIAPSNVVLPGDGQPGISYRTQASTTYSTLAAAKAATTSFEPRATADGWFNLHYSNGACYSLQNMRYGTTGDYLGVGTGYCSSARSKWKTVNGTLVNASSPGQAFGSTFSSIYTVDYQRMYWYSMIGLSSVGFPLAEGADALRPFTATVRSKDVANRTAVLEGRAAAGAAVRIEGHGEVVADDTGGWSAPVSGLDLGLNTLSVELWKGGAKTDQISVEVDIPVSEVTATTTFPAVLTENAVLSGTAHPGATVVISDAADTEIGRTTAARTDTGEWGMTVPAPNVGGDYPVAIRQVIDDVDNGEIDHTVSYGAAVAVTSPLDDAEHDGGPVAMTGTGEPHAQITVHEQGDHTAVGNATVLGDGNWTLDTTPVNDGKHVLGVTQTGKGNNVTTSTITLNPEAGGVAPVTVETPENGSSVTISRPTFTGHGQDGATVTIGYGANSIIGSAVVTDGEWTIAPTRGLGMGVSDLIVTQTIGDDVQTIHHSLTRVAVELPFTVTSHADGQTYAQGMTTFRGTAPVGSVVRATNQWGTPMGTAAATDGTWSFNRNLGPTTAGYDLIFTATPPVGDPQTVSLKLNYAGVLAFQVTSPVNNSTYAVGTTTFTGTAVPNAVVTATNQWGTPMGRATASLAGTWAFDRYLGPTSAGYDITFVATKGTDTQRTALHLDTAVVTVPVTVTSIADGATYRPGMNVLTGTGTPGATVVAVNATNGWNVPMGRATVGTDGTWALPERNWGPSNDYAIQVTQTNPDTTTSSTTVNVKAPAFTALTLTSPAVGDTYDTGVAALFEGTATPFAEITVRSAQSSTVYRTVQADADGNWSFTRVWGPTHDYVLTIDQKAKNGQSDAITGFAWNHSGN